MDWTVFIDLDDTLIDTSHRQYHVYADILNCYQVTPVLTKKYFWELKRMGKKTAELLPHDLPDSLIQSFTDQWFDRIESCNYLRYDQLMPQTFEALSYLKASSNLILVTMRKNKEDLKWELDNLELLPYFKEILVPSSSLEDKSVLVEEYLDKHSPKNSLAIIGDSEVDVQTGQKIGMLTIAVSYGQRSGAFLRKMHPDHCLDSLLKVAKIIR